MIKSLVYIFFIISVVESHGQPTGFNFDFNISFNNKIIIIAPEYSNLLSGNQNVKKHIPFQINSIDKRFTFIFKNFFVKRGDQYRHEKGYLTVPKDMIGSSFTQKIWVKSDSEIVLIDNYRKDTMCIVIKNIEKPTFLNIEFEKGRFILNAKDSESNKYKNLFFLNPSQFRHEWKMLDGSLKRIYLKKQERTYPHSNLKFDYILTNPKDSSFVKIKYSGDFGRIFGVNYSLKENLPDGKYEIYIDKTVRQVAYFKNKLKDSLWVEYLSDGIKRTIPFKRDSVDGVIKEFYKDNTLKRKSIIRKNQILNRVSYYQSSKIKMHEEFQNGKCIKIKYFDEEGKLKNKKIFDDSSKTNNKTELIKTVKDTVSKDECISFIYQENIIPSFKFENLNFKPFGKNYL